MTLGYLIEIQGIKRQDLKGNGVKGRETEDRRWRPVVGCRMSDVGCRKKKPIGNLALLKGFFLS